MPDNPVEQYSAENINLAGVGVFNSQEGNTFQFRGIESANASLIVTLNAGNNTVLLTLDIASIVDDIPDATTTQRGVLETATDAEALAKVATNKIVTPSNFAAMGSTTAFAGLIEIATNAEALAGAATNLAIVPSSLAAVIATLEQTRVFADAVARAAAIPDFEGQFGAQADTNQAYLALSLVAGDWTPIFTFGGTTGPITANTSIDLSNSVTVVSTAVTGNWTFGTGLVVEFAAGDFNWNNPRMQIAGVTIPDLSLFGTDNSGGGIPTSYLINTFISSNNTQTGWSVTNPVVNRTLDVSAATLGDLREIVGTLINDLKAIKLPAT